MSYSQELLAQATELAHKTGPNQADLRRSVSAAYYALFHLLIQETVANWGFVESRNVLARVFEHSTMAKASLRLQDTRLFPFNGENVELVKSLRSVGFTFLQMQENRHIADYDNSRTWDKTDVHQLLVKTSSAMIEWSLIRNQKIAQDYLVSLLIKVRS